MEKKQGKVNKALKVFGLRKFWSDLLMPHKKEFRLIIFNYLNEMNNQQSKPPKMHDIQFATQQL